MKTAPTDVPHVTQLDALVTVDRCWLPKAFSVLENEGLQYEQKRAPQRIPMVKQFHLPGETETVIRIIQNTTAYRKAHRLYIFHPACLEIMARPSRLREEK